MGIVQEQNERMARDFHKWVCYRVRVKEDTRDIPNMKIYTRLVSAMFNQHITEGYIYGSFNVDKKFDQKKARTILTKHTGVEWLIN